jgi:hypothetical protein
MERKELFYFYRCCFTAAAFKVILRNYIIGTTGVIYHLAALHAREPKRILTVF